MSAGGWGTPPVLAQGLERQGAVETGLAGPLDAWEVPQGAEALAARLLAVFWLSHAERRAARGRQCEAAEAGRAKRGLDLFLGQNRTNGGRSDAEAL